MVLDRLLIPKRHVLKAQEHITTHLENATELESPRDFGGCCKEPEHLHNITGDPAYDDGNSETFARPGLEVFEYLGYWKGRFNRKSEVSDCS